MNNPAADKIIETAKPGGNSGGDDPVRQNRIQEKKHRRDRFNRLMSNSTLTLGALIFIAMAFLAMAGPSLSPYDPFAMTVPDRLQGPAPRHLLGTDEFGRDLLTRIIYGARVSMGIGFGVTFLSSALGLIIGVYAAYYRILDHILMRLCDALAAFPGILLAITLMAALGASAGNVLVALVIVYTPGIARVVRSRALVIKEAAFIEALRTQGAGNRRIIWKHIVPNTLSPLLVQASFVFAGAIISEASLSFLGAGIPPPAASWGNILQAGKAVIHKAWWMVVFPGLMIIFSVLGLTMIGDGLQDFFGRPGRTKKR